MKIGFYLKVALMVGCILVSTGSSGFAFVTPEHYEKLRQEARGKEKNESQTDREVPGKIQVHHPSPSKPVPDRPAKK